MWHWKRKYALAASYVRREILITKTLIAEWLWSLARLKWKLPRRRTIDKRGKGACSFNKRHEVNESNEVLAISWHAVFAQENKNARMGAPLRPDPKVLTLPCAQTPLTRNCLPSMLTTPKSEFLST
jgi:hypothetical protein